VKRYGLLAVIAANLLVLMALAFAYPHLMVSPGPLVRGHAEIAANCFACHAPWRGAASDRCVTCHALPDIGLRTTRGVALPRKGFVTSFHQELIEQDCMACHGDHAGSTRGQRSRKPFSHALLRAAVRDRCEACHAAPKNDLHRGSSGGCGQCHKPQAWKPATFEHGKFFAFDTNHATTCATCHPGNDTKHYTCYGCHEHQPDRVRTQHREEGIADIENCVACHRSADKEAAERGAGEERERD